MKVVALLIVILGLFTAAQSQGADLGTLGKQLVDTVVQKGKEVLANVANNLLASLLGKIGKRSVLTDSIKDKVHGVVEKIGNLLDQAKEQGAGFFQSALDKLKAAADALHKKIGSLTNKDSDNVIDSIVDDHNNKQKRLVSDLIQKGKDLLSGLYGKAKDVAALVKAKASQVVSGLLQKGVDLIGKRGLTDHLQTIGNALSGAVSPFKDIVAGLGNTLKGHFSNLVDTIKGHANALKDKLAGHVDDLKGHGQKLLEHGKNAIGALSEVVKDILQQTIANATPHLNGAAKTISDAGNTVIKHLTGSDSNSSF
jgi:phage-related protein